MKKNGRSILTALLCLLLVLTMAGCGQSKTPPADADGGDGGTVAEAETGAADADGSSQENDEENAGETGDESGAEDGKTDAGETAAQGGSEGHVHKYKSKTVKADCTSGGYTTHVCSCGASYTDGRTGALGHSYGSWSIERQATVSAPGSRVRTCSRCGYVQRETIAQLTDTSSYASEVIRLVNQERAAAGLSPLTAVSALNSFAYQRSTELETLFAHQRPDGSNPLNYVAGLGYMSAGENIAASSGMNDTPQRVMNSWMASDGHRRNILDPDFSYIGVGCYVHNGSFYWTQIFAG